MQSNRRTFLKNTGKATAAAAFTLNAVKGSRAYGAYGANDTVRAAVCGIRSRGKSHIADLSKVPGVEVVALCDVDERELAARSSEFTKAGRPQPTLYTDMRKLFEDKSIDVVSFATPNHWHTLGGIWAMEAGKEVYVEKPCSHNVWEGRMLVQASRRYNRICQHGTQIRSSVAVREGMELLREGVSGDVYMAKGLCYKFRDTIGKTPEEKPPEGVHYDLWLGPAPKRAYSRNRFHYNWHWHWAYGNGDIGNQGVHQMDLARWGLGVGLPSRVQSMGGHFMFDDDQETPNTQIATMSYPDEKKMLVFEVRHWYSNNENVGGRPQGAVGAIFYGTEGIMVIPSYSEYRVYHGANHEPGPSAQQRGDHFGNFIDAVRKGDKSVLNAEIEEGHQSAALCHLALLAYRLGRTVEFDPATERCIGDAEANTLLTREYRAPFVVPDFA